MSIKSVEQSLPLSIVDLPEEILFTMFQTTHLSFQDLARCTITCPTLCRIVHDSSLKKEYEKRLLPPCDTQENETRAIQNITDLFAKLHITPFPNVSWMQVQSEWTRRKYVIIIDSSLSMTHTPGAPIPTYWEHAVAIVKRIISSLGYIKEEGIYVWASEQNANNAFDKKFIKTEEELHLFINSFPLQSSAGMADAVTTIFKSNFIKTAQAVEVIILSDFQYAPKDLLKQFSEIKKSQKKRKKTWMPISFHLFNTLQTPTEHFHKLLKYEQTDRFRIYNFDLKLT